MNKYRLSEERRAMMERMQIPFAIFQLIEKEVHIVVLSDAFCRLFGVDDREKAYDDAEEVLFRNVHPDDLSRIADGEYHFAQEYGLYEEIYRLKKPDSSGYNVIHAMGKHVDLETGERLVQVWYMNEGSYTDESMLRMNGLNSTLNKALHEESILRSSYYDYLTGLPGMIHFFELAGSGREIMHKDGVDSVIIYMNLVGMKFYNHRYGFSQGNKLLQSFAGLLIRYFGAENCSRFGQDHFVVYTAQDEAEKLLNSLFREWKEFHGKDALQIHAGIYKDSLEPVTVSTACDRARTACDSMKMAYASNFSYFSSAMREEEYRRQYILANFDTALNEKWIQVYYQPIVRAINGRVCDEEALARWVDPEKGIMPPKDFIPLLEDSRLIYKLDLYVVEQVLDKLKLQKKQGLHMVPQSVNLSRSDFDVCDIVEEIRTRVDDAGISRELITVEITESMLSRDYEFMKARIIRFMELGFPVWMDDFGSGYSNLNVLRDIKFNLVKFDIQFMKRLEQDSRSRILITELMKMMTVLGVDTVCEGVEKEKQVKFLQEIGCSKLQGYYFCMPVTFEEIINRYKKGIQIGFENPEESAYYETIGRVNLFDMSLVIDEKGMAGYFNTLPMGIMEINSERVRFIRANKQYRDFMMRFFRLDILDNNRSYTDMQAGTGETFIAKVRKCMEGSGPVFIDETMPDNTVIRSFARKISVNPVNGITAVAVVVLQISEKT